MKLFTVTPSERHLSIKALMIVQSVTCEMLEKVRKVLNDHSLNRASDFAHALQEVAKKAEAQ